jgi:hypothetical protein
MERILATILPRRSFNEAGFRHHGKTSKKAKIFDFEPVKIINDAPFCKK